MVETDDRGREKWAGTIYQYQCSEPCDWEATGPLDLVRAQFEMHILGNWGMGINHRLRMMKNAYLVVEIPSALTDQQKGLVAGILKAALTNVEVLLEIGVPGYSALLAAEREAEQAAGGVESGFQFTQPDVEGVPV